MKKSIKNKKIIFCLILLGVFIIPSTVLALQVNWPSSPAGTDLTPDSTLPQLVQYLYEWGILLGGLAAFIALIIAGFQYITSVGNPTVMKEAMDRIKGAALGLVLLLSSWLILNTINPQLTTFPPLELKPPPEKEVSPYQRCGPGLPKCPDNYVCEKNFCVPEEPASESCESVTLSGAVNTTIKAGDCPSVFIKAGKTFTASTPERCAGILLLYGRKDCEDLRATAGVNDKNIIADVDIQSIKLLAK